MSLNRISPSPPAYSATGPFRPFSSSAAPLATPDSGPLFSQPRSRFASTSTSKAFQSELFEAGTRASCRDRHTPLAFQPVRDRHLRAHRRGRPRLHPDRRPAHQRRPLANTPTRRGAGGCRWGASSGSRDWRRAVGVRDETRLAASRTQPFTTHFTALCVECDRIGGDVSARSSRKCLSYRHRTFSQPGSVRQVCRRQCIERTPPAGRPGTTD